MDRRGVRKHFSEHPEDYYKLVRISIKYDEFESMDFLWAKRLLDFSSASSEIDSLVSFALEFGSVKMIDYLHDRGMRFRSRNHAHTFTDNNDTPYDPVEIVIKRGDVSFAKHMMYDNEFFNITNQNMAYAKRLLLAADTTDKEKEICRLVITRKNMSSYDHNNKASDYSGVAEQNLLANINKLMVQLAGAKESQKEMLAEERTKYRKLFHWAESLQASLAESEESGRSLQSRFETVIINLRQQTEAKDTVQASLAKSEATRRSLQSRFEIVMANLREQTQAKNTLQASLAESEATRRSLESRFEIVMANLREQTQAKNKFEERASHFKDRADYWQVQHVALKDRAERAERDLAQCLSNLNTRNQQHSHRNQEPAQPPPPPAAAATMMWKCTSKYGGAATTQQRLDSCKRARDGTFQTRQGCIEQCKNF